MKRLNRSILSDYEIPVNRPGRLCGVQFGDDPLLMGFVDRLIDDANLGGANIGLAVVQPGESGHAAQLKEQEKPQEIPQMMPQEEQQKKQEMLPII